MKEKHFRTITANFVIVAVLAVTFGIAFAAAYPTGGQSVVSVNDAIYFGDENSQNVALMFNVYERTDNVEKIANIFTEYGFNATFFVGGSWVARNGDAVIKLSSSGFEIGNHGYLHRDHAKLDYEQNLAEIRLTEDMLAQTLSALPDYSSSMLFAPPSGSIGDNMFKACKALNMRVIMWTRDTIDWRDHDAEIIYQRAIKDVKSGDLILMHPTDCTVDALPRVLDYLRDAGLCANTVTNTIG